MHNYEHPVFFRYEVTAMGFANWHLFYCSIIALNSQSVQGSSFSNFKGSGGIFIKCDLLS